MIKPEDSPIIHIIIAMLVGGAVGALAVMILHRYLQYLLWM